MKVSEFIKELKKCNPESEVICAYDECEQQITHSDCLYKIKTIKVEYPYYIYLIVKPVKIEKK